MKHIINLSLRLTVVCVAASAGLAAVYSLTADRIMNNEKQELQEKLKSVIPEADRFEKNDFEYVGYKENEKVGVAVQLSPSQRYS